MEGGNVPWKTGESSMKVGKNWWKIKVGKVGNSVKGDKSIRNGDNGTFWNQKIPLKKWMKFTRSMICLLLEVTKYFEFQNFFAGMTLFNFFQNE